MAFLSNPPPVTEVRITVPGYFANPLLRRGIVLAALPSGKPRVRFLFDDKVGWTFHALSDAGILILREVPHFIWG